jgi:hypothetical protein
VSWFSDAFLGVKRIIQLDADVARLDRAAEKADAMLWDHEKRLIRIETMNEVRESPSRLPPPSGLCLARVP